MTGSKPKIKFAVIGAEHGHIFEIVRLLLDAGGDFASFYVENARQAAEFRRSFPSAVHFKEARQILEDRSIELIASASVPNQRAAVGLEAMGHGKDFVSAKPAATTLEQLAEVRQVQAETGRIFSIYYSERFGNRATVKAGDMIANGAVGKVVQTIGLGPHRLNAATREPWFFDREKYGGIICDLGSHQVDQFLFLTASTEAKIVAAQSGNFAHPQFSDFEDFGDVSIRGNNGLGYFRVDWLSPSGLSAWGDARLTVLGTDGYVEIRKNIDLEGRPGGDHLFLVNNQGSQYIDCSLTPLTYGKQLTNDILSRTETAMSQKHCFLATELSLLAQGLSQKI